MLRKVALVLPLLAGLALLGGCLGQTEKPRVMPAAANEGLSASTPVAATAKSPAPRAVHPAPDFTLPDLEGNELCLSDLEGQVVLVNFWTTCAVRAPAPSSRPSATERPLPFQMKRSGIW